MTVLIVRSVEYTFSHVEIILITVYVLLTFSIAYDQSILCFNQHVEHFYESFIIFGLRQHTEDFRKSTATGPPLQESLRDFLDCSQIEVIFTWGIVHDRRG